MPVPSTRHRGQGKAMEILKQKDLCNLSMKKRYFLEDEDGSVPLNDFSTRARLSPLHVLI